jgi:hypothetical protein
VLLTGTGGRKQRTPVFASHCALSVVSLVHTSRPSREADDARCKSDWILSSRGVSVTYPLCALAVFGIVGYHVLREFFVIGCCLSGEYSHFSSVILPSNTAD